jgi:hypothetical protein
MSTSPLFIKFDKCLDSLRCDELAGDGGFAADNRFVGQGPGMSLSEKEVANAHA